MSTDISETEALLLLLQHYPPLSGKGIEASLLQEIQDELATFCLAREDFDVVTERWKRAGEVPSLAQFLDSLRDASTLRIKAHGH